MVTLENIIDAIPFPIRKSGKRLGASTRLEEDLAIYGDEAEQLIIVFSNSFNVDITKFEFSQYFTEERTLFSRVSSLFLKKKPQPKRKTLTLGNLVDAANNGKLE